MKTVSEVLAMAGDSNIHVKTLQAAAGDILGKDNVPASREEIRKALETFVPPAVSTDQMVEVRLLRKYAPRGKYVVLEDGVVSVFDQAVDGIMNTVAVGATVKFPKAEVGHVLKNKIAEVTVSTFA